MKKISLLFVSENLLPQSHTTECLDILSYKFNIIDKIDLDFTYKNFGLNGTVEKIKSVILNFRIEFLIISIGASRLIDPDEINNLRGLRNPLSICLLFSDSETLFTNNDFYYAQHADFCWIYNPAMTSTFKMYDIPVVVGQLFDYKLYRKNRFVRKDISLSFIGGVIRSNRLDFLKLIKEKIPNIYIAGYGSKQGIIDRDSKNKIIGRSLIHINFSGVHDIYLNRNKRLFGFKGRIVEALLSGTFPLCQWDPNLFNFFGKDTLYFKDSNDFYKLYLLLINDFEYMNLVRKRMLTNYLKLYSNKKILLSLQNQINIKHKKYPIYYDFDFLLLFNLQRFYYIGYFISKLKFVNAVQEIKSIKNGIYINQIHQYFYQILRGIYNSFVTLKIKL